MLTELVASQATTTLTLILGFAVTVLTMFYNAWNASAERRQAITLADRKAADVATDLATRASADKQELASLVLATAEALQKKTTAMETSSIAARNRLRDQLIDVGKSAQSAYREANSVNTKIADIHAANRVVLDKLEEVGKSAKDAYHEANSVNNKIAELHKEGTETSERLGREQQSVNAKRHEQLKNMEAVGVDTNRKVDILLPDKDANGTISG